MNAPVEQITAALLREWTLPEPGGSKHSRGQVVVVGGARSTPGAVLLAGLAALRVGAGVLAMLVPEPVAVPLAIAVPEAAVTGWPDPIEQSPDGAARVAEQVGRAGAVLVGPGLDSAEQAKVLVAAVAEAVPASVPVVLDAYALGVLPDLSGAARKLAGHLVLTPNRTEAGYLLSTEIDEDSDPVDVARRLAQRWQAVVSYQGAVAATETPARVSSTGHAGLGTSGSGDVLAGAIVGLLARGVDPAEAAGWGTYLHAAAGDRLAARVGRLGFLARELLDELPLVLTELQA